MTKHEMTPETQIALDNFANLSKMLTANQAKADDLIERRRQAMVLLLKANVPASVIAEASEISPQAVYKVRDAAKALLAEEVTTDAPGVE